MGIFTSVPDFLPKLIMRNPENKYTIEFLKMYWNIKIPGLEFVP
jgi:hypothetical protein